MTADRGSLHSRLSATAADYRHIHEEHRRAGPEGHTRRQLDARLEELASQFERLLNEARLGEPDRERWRQHLYHGAPEPETPAREDASPPAARRPPRNRGRGSAPFWQR